MKFNYWINQYRATRYDILILICNHLSSVDQATSMSSASASKLKKANELLSELESELLTGISTEITQDFANLHKTIRISKK